MDEKTYYQGTGRRKSAVAQVRLFRRGGAAGDAIVVNGTPYEEFSSRLAHLEMIKKPLLVTETLGKYSVVIKVSGGGITGQSGAISHGIARALVKADESLKPVLRKHGLLTRIARVKERKKVGLKRARKAPQSPKR